VSNSLPVLRFVFANPKKFGEREISKRCIAGEVNETVCPEKGPQFLHLGLCPLIAPDQRRSNNFVAIIEQYGAVHLARESNAGNFVGSSSAAGESASHSQRRGSPPIARILFCPSQLRAGKRNVLLGAGRDNAAMFIDDKCAGAARTNIDPKKADSPSWLKDHRGINAAVALRCCRYLARFVALEFMPVD